MAPDELSPELRAEWDRLNAAYDTADESGNADAIEQANDALAAFAEQYGISDGCNFDPDDDPPPAEPPTDPETIARAMLQAAEEGDTESIDALKQLGKPPQS